MIKRPKTLELKIPTKRSYANRSTTHSSIYLDHKIHRPSRPKTAKTTPYRVWDSSKPVPYRFHKRQFSRFRSSGDISIGPLRTGKRQIRRSKTVYPDVPRWSNLRMYPKRKEATFDKPGSCFQDRHRHKRIIAQTTSIDEFISPKFTRSKSIPNLATFPRQDIRDVWRKHTPLNSEWNSKTPRTPSTHRTLIGNILMHSC